MSRRSRRFKRYQFVTPVRLYRYSQEAGTPTYDENNVPSTFQTPVIAWSGKVHLAPTIFLRQRREWPDPTDYEGAQQDIAFYTLVGPPDMDPDKDDYLAHVDSDGNILRYFQQVSPPKELGNVPAAFWHLDLSQPLPEVP